MPTPTTNLAPHQVEFFDHNGFLFLDALISQAELSMLRDVYDRLFDERVGWAEGRQFDLGGTDAEGEPPKLPQILGPSEYAPELVNTEYLRNAKAIAQQLFGGDLEDAYGEHMIFKPPRYGATTPWHQDQAYHDPGKIFRGVSFWMPLDDATVDSGCMQFVPGSHRTTDVVPHHSIGHDPTVHGLEADDPESLAPYAVACPIPAGGCTMHAAYTFHYAGPNTSERPRRAYILSFTATPQVRELPIDNYWMREKRTAGMERERSSAM